MDLQVSQIMPQRGGRNQSNYGGQGYQGNRQQGSQYQDNNFGGGNQNYQQQRNPRN